MAKQSAGLLNRTGVDQAEERQGGIGVGVRGGLGSSRPENLHGADGDFLSVAPGLVPKAARFHSSSNVTILADPSLAYSV
jgi:hypothetical protein